jgi:hypothetical protein
MVRVPCLVKELVQLEVDSVERCVLEEECGEQSLVHLGLVESDI